MRIVVQRVKNAQCVVNDELISKIDKGLLLLIGFNKEDEKNIDFDFVVKKIINMRIFSDENDKMNLSILDIKGEILAISQFTLYGDIRKGNRPSFTEALNYQIASEYYDSLVDKFNENVNTKKGIFGADMKITFTNDGPVTIIYDSKDFC